MQKLIKIGLEDISDCFDMKENLYEKYIIPEIYSNSLCSSIISRRESMNWKIETPLGGPGTVLNSFALYCLIRHYSLKSVFETGVSGGFYSFFLLKALEIEKGILTSVELDDSNKVGSLIDLPFPSHWNLNRGNDSLQYLKNNNIQVDLYCHDSLHSLSHMTKEIIFFKRCVKNTFFIYIDDQNSDNFWKKSIRTGLFNLNGYKISYISGNESRLNGHLGGFIKYERIDF